jgi:hypothetical protein
LKKQHNTIAVLIGLFILVSTTILSAQEYALTISIIDEESKDPLEGVTVLITPCDCGGISNTSGIFSKRLQKEYIIYP